MPLCQFCHLHKTNLLRHYLTCKSNPQAVSSPALRVAWQRANDEGAAAAAAGAAAAADKKDEYGADWSDVVGLEGGGDDEPDAHGNSSDEEEVRAHMARSVTLPLTLPSRVDWAHSMCSRSGRCALFLCRHDAARPSRLLQPPQHRKPLCVATSPPSLSICCCSSSPGQPTIVFRRPR